MIDVDFPKPYCRRIWSPSEDEETPWAVSVEATFGGMHYFFATWDEAMLCANWHAVHNPFYAGEARDES